MRHPAAAPLLFAIGLGATFLGDVLARLDEHAAHASLAVHGIHTILVAVPAGMLAALLLREERIVAAALLSVAGWAAGLLILGALSFNVARP